MGRPAVRPTAHDDAAIERVCVSLAEGMGMREACAGQDRPTHTAVYARMAADEVFFSRIARAREAQQHAIVDETIRLADSATPENWQVVRMQIWARQWHAAKLAPRHYGDKLQTQQLGKDGQPVDPAVPAVAITISRNG